MKLKVIRKWFTKDSTIGELYIDGVFFCYTLEDTIRAVKVYGETAIPYGRYDVVLRKSPTFERVLPRLKNVPGFEGVLIHNGNHKGHTKGCILLGLTRSKDFVGMSRVAMSKIMPRLGLANEIDITIEKENFNTGCV